MAKKYEILIYFAVEFFRTNKSEICFFLNNREAKKLRLEKRTGIHPNGTRKF